ncbi:dipeptidase [Burkholderia cepacia]|uniref:D-alanyl-D-alanine dipeptidase n=1 Tax=Burkholderia cepacia TaxID=292 RepID=A0AAX2REF8_BURCE|nr:MULTISPECIES: M15 family metallopeptidase [Burkholderia]EMD9442821.1 D-alanyl-D-alanine carboxypeptidase family protein [Burkholderia cepacia]KVU48926.1 dipeptidase [Burkholderia cepacia]KWE23602.1 dipeptidase [Burkholderia cepacia]MBJ9749679.1 D-alanyl-D-alanine carboxypeptidase family protein [Burkholderia cepacia]MBY4805984.1 D-alanyl-D-alanine carboxypeptidase family protein [Burkholderia cepacia]
MARNRHRAIPSAIVISLSDPAVRSIALLESHEGFVDLAGFHDRIAVDPGRDDAAHSSRHFLKVRHGVAQRLIAAAHALPDGLRLYVKEGYRPLALQRHYFTRHLAHLRRTLNPLPDEDTLVALTSHYVAPPEVAAHPTGAAVDLTLISTDGVELDMGCVLDATDQESSGACYTHNPFISRAAARHRQVLIAALTGAGFTNYPSEWWHWSFGDRYWAVMHNQSHAIYGPVEESMLDEAAR